VGRRIFLTKRELNILRAPVKQKCLSRNSRLTLTLTRIGLWLHLALGLAAITYFFYIIPYERVSHEGFGLGLHGKQTIETVLAAVETRCGKPYEVLTNKETGTEKWRFHTKTQRIVVLHNASADYDCAVLVMKLEGAPPGNTADISTDRGLTIGSTVSQIYAQYANSILADPAGLNELTVQRETWESSKTLISAVGSINGQQRILFLGFENGKLNKFYEFFLPLSPYSKRAYSHLFIEFTEGPTLTDFVFLLFFALPVVVLYVMLSHGASFHQRRKWVTSLFASLPYLPFAAWMRCRDDVLHYAQRDPSFIAFLIALSGVPLIIGIYSVITIGLRSFSEDEVNGLEGIPVLGRLTNYMMTFDNFVRGAFTAVVVLLAVSILSLLLCYPFAVLLAGLLPW
jgi:hypothetical protein